MGFGVGFGFGFGFGGDWVVGDVVGCRSGERGGGWSGRYLPGFSRLVMNGERLFEAFWLSMPMSGFPNSNLKWM